MSAEPISAAPRIRPATPAPIPVAGALLLVVALGLVLLFTGLGLRTFVITSGSMGEAAPAGALVVTVRPDPALLVPGAIVTFRDDAGRLVTHRIVRRVADGGAVAVVVRGDANPAADPAAVPYGRIVGVVRLAVPGAGFVVAALRDPRVLLLLAGFVVLGRALRRSS